jgi:6,7-dimethyl-8-ribityllumazine synthase
MNEYKGSLDATGKRYAIVAARFNETYVQNLVDGAVDCLNRLGADEDDVDIYWVPGSFEIPFTARAAARSGDYDAVIGLGVIIRGATAHFDLIAREAAAGIAAVGRDTGVPAIFGVVTAENLEQAAERCGSKMGNKGWEAAQSAVEMVNLGQAFLGREEAEALIDEEGRGPESAGEAKPSAARESRGPAKDRSGGGRAPRV